MAVRIRIATKIFALAVALLCLTVALSAFGTWQTRRIKVALLRITQRDIPLDGILQDLDKDGLERRLQFERWLAALGRVPNPGDADQASKDYQAIDKTVERDVARAKVFLDHVPAADADAVDLARIRGLLDEVQRDNALIHGFQQRALEHQRHGDSARVQEFFDIEDALEGALTDRRMELAAKISSLTDRATDIAESREQMLLNITAAATGFAILFGLVFAWLMSRRMVQPVQVLLSGVRSVEGGDLSVELPVRSTDEIGVLTGSFNKLIDQLRAKEQLKETFGKYVDPRIVENVILNPAVAEAEGGKRVMTVSFCDLVGFTGIGESLTPAGLVRLLNRHFALMADAIHENQGVLDKFIGDAVMAFWGPPFTASSEHATLACRAALAQLRLLENFRAELPELTGLRRNLPEVDLRVGLASGDVIAGNIGSESARSYTVIGDTVNLASRLENVNRIYGTQVLLNREARQLAAQTVETREIDWIAVKGKTEPVEIYELLGLAGEVSQQRLLLRDRYEEAVAAYRKFDWAAAATALRGALEADPEDRPSQVLLSRVERFQAEPPEPDWDGVWHLAEK
jgi:adenylate cyclase